MTISGGSALSQGRHRPDGQGRRAARRGGHDASRGDRDPQPAESLVYSTEKFLAEQRRQGPRRAPRTGRRRLSTDLKEAIKPESNASAEDIQAKITTLNNASQEMGAAIYAAAAEQGESGDVPGAEAGDGGQPATDAGDDDVVDAEIVEDDEDAKETK